MTRVKICCIASEAEARIAIAHGASAIGLVSEMPSGPGVISEKAIRTIARSIPPGISSFLLTCLRDSRSIVDQHRRCRTSTIQICDTLEYHEYDVLRESLPGISLVQVVHVTGPESVDEAIAVAQFVDAILLDSGNQKLAVKELGGTGRVHDWSLSRQIVDSVDAPVFLAGGLNEENVREAIDTVAPFALDLCGGVRSHGLLDKSKVKSFMNAINGVRR